MKFMNYKITLPNGFVGLATCHRDLIEMLTEAESKGFALADIKIEESRSRVSQLLHAQAAQVERKTDGISPAAASVGETL